MTRKEIEEGYEIDERGVIRSPGKFEGEMLYAPYFWEALLNGESDGEQDDMDWFTVQDEDCQQFPELTDVEKVGLRTDDMGFVYLETVEGAQTR